MIMDNESLYRLKESKCCPKVSQYELCSDLDGVGDHLLHGVLHSRVGRHGLRQSRDPSSWLEPGLIHGLQVIIGSKIGGVFLQSRQSRGLVIVRSSCHWS